LNRLNLIRAEHSGRSDSSRFVSVLSGKGGVGKSIIAFNLGDVMARRGLRTLLVDADISSGDLHVMANVRADYGIAQFASGELSLREAVAHVHDGLDILVASQSDSLVDSSNVTAAARLMERLRSEASSYDFVLLDHGSGVNAQAVVMAHASDLNILVLVPELTSIADCYGLYKHLLNANREIDSRLLPNRIQAEEEAEYIREKFAAMAHRFLGRVPRYLGYIPEDRTVRTALASQVAISQSDMNSPAAAALSDVAAVLADTLSDGMSEESGIPQKTISKTLATADTRG
jgi:flagellar biosynthesis protein FlhG